MKRVFGIVGYACNGKSTIIKKLMDQSCNYKLVDLAIIYKDEALKNGYDGVTQWYTSIGLSEYKKRSMFAVIKYLESVNDDNNLIIDDIFDFDVLNYILNRFAHISLISVNSRFEDRIRRLSMRSGVHNYEDLVTGIYLRDNMKKYCGIEEVLLNCNRCIDNTGNINTVVNHMICEINKAFIICILGYSGSGKSTLNNLLSKNLNIENFKYGNMIKEIVNARGYDKSRDFVYNEGIDEY